MYDAKGTINKVILIGRLGQDPELKYTPNGSPVVNISLATNTIHKDKDGNSTEQTEWTRCVVWGKSAEAVAEYNKKGSRIYVEGRLKTRSWDDEDGNKRYMTEIVVSQTQFLDSKSSRSDDQIDGDGGDDLPF